jgi:hypothetical protein
LILKIVLSAPQASLNAIGEKEYKVLTVTFLVSLDTFFIYNPVYLFLLVGSVIWFLVLSEK